MLDRNWQAWDHPNSDLGDFFRKQVREAIRRFRMFEKDEPVLVAVSGGNEIDRSSQESQ